MKKWTETELDEIERALAGVDEVKKYGGRDYTQEWLACVTGFGVGVAVTILVGWAI